MAGMVVQHNLNAINANNKLNMNVIGTKKSTEKLSSGYQINRAGDNAAGLAISEKMRAQTRGLKQAINNSNDGISLIQTAEGGLNETHAILQRMRELAVQSANGTYQNKVDREAMQLEVDRLKSEVDRISTSTQYNNITLLDGSLGMGENNGKYGANYGIHQTNLGGNDVTITSSIKDVQLNIVAGADNTGSSGVGGENAIWDDTGKVLTINLTQGKSYTDKQMQALIDNADISKINGSAPAKVEYKTDSGVSKYAEDQLSDATVAGVRQASEDTDVTALIGNNDSDTIRHANLISFTANSYGDAKGNPQSTSLTKITIDTGSASSVAKGKERVDVTTPQVTGDSGEEITLYLATGVDYTEKDIEQILSKAGYDYSVKLTDAAGDADPDGDVKFRANQRGTVDVDLSIEGNGVGKESVTGGQGLTFQIGANGVADQQVTLSVKNMGAGALGIDGASVALQPDANAAITSFDDAINSVSMQRAELGALQNRLEYTVNNLTATNENLTAAESQIRDTDMANEMISYTKFNILQQASQAMLAQANQAPQAVLQLLG